MQQLCCKSVWLNSFELKYKVIVKQDRMNVQGYIKFSRGWKRPNLDISAFLKKARPLNNISLTKTFIFWFWMSSSIRPVDYNTGSRLSNDKMTLKPFVNVVRPSSQFPKDDDILFQRWKRRQQSEKNSNIRYVLFTDYHLQLWNNYYFYLLTLLKINYNQMKPFLHFYSILILLSKKTFLFVSKGFKCLIFFQII